MLQRMADVWGRTAWGGRVVALVLLCAAAYGCGGLVLGEALPFAPTADTSDAATSHYPAAVHLRDSVLQRGAFPLWRTGLMGGAPFAANPLNKVAYPLQWLALAVPPQAHLNGMLALHAVIAAAGMWAWLGTQGLSVAARALGVLAWVLAPRMAGHVGLGHVDVYYALAWLPCLMWAVAAVGNGGRPLCVALIAALLLGADVRVALFGWGLALVYGIARALPRPRISLSSAGRWLLALVMLGALSAGVVVPLLLWGPYLNRAALTVADAGVFALDGGSMLGLLVPLHNGNAEQLTYLGIGVLGLALYALVRAPRRLWGWGVLVLLAALYALGASTPLWSTLVTAVPQLLWFRVPSRAWLVVALLVPLLAAHGAHLLLRSIAEYVPPPPAPDTDADKPKTPWRLMLARLGMAGGALGALLCGALSLTIPQFPLSSAVSVMAFGAAFALLGVAGLYNKVSARAMAAALLVVTCADLLWTARALVEWRPPARWLTNYSGLAARLQDAEPALIYSPSYTVPQEVAATYGLRVFGGIDPFQLRAVSQAIADAGGVPLTQYSITSPPLVVPPPLIASSDDTESEGDDTQTDFNVNRAYTPDAAALARWGVSHVVAWYPIDAPQLDLLETVEVRVTVLGGKTSTQTAHVYVNRAYAARDTSPLTGWPADAAVWPSDAIIAELHRATLAAWGVSISALLVCVAGLGVGLRGGEPTHRSADVV
jgi:hypothetical protein